MAQTSQGPTRIEAVGSMTRLVMGVAGGSGTSTVVTIANCGKVIAVVVGGATSATAPYCDTVSGKTFTVTHASSDKFSYIALVDGGI